MRLTRVFVGGAQLRANTEIALPEGAARHLTRVLRLKTGARLVLFDGSGQYFDAELHRNSGSGLSALVRESLGSDPVPSLTVTLVQAVSRGDSMDMIVQKATELGVQRIVPVISERSVVRLGPERAEKRRAHWEAVAVGACEQSGRNSLPEIHVPVPLSTYLDRADPGFSVVLEPGADTRLSGLTTRAGTISLLLGPEGGLTDDEVDIAARQGFRRVNLGPRILRAETAAIAAVTLAQSLWGDMAGS